MNFFCRLTMVIPRLPYIFNMAKAVSSKVVLVNSETSDSDNCFHFAMCAFASNYFPMELVPCSDGWRRTWSQTIHMIPWLLVSSIPQWKLKRHEGACQDLFQATGCFEPTFIEAHQVSIVIGKVRLLKSRIKTHSFLEDLRTSSNKVAIVWESDMVVGIWKLCNSSCETVKSYIIIEQNVGA